MTNEYLKPQTPLKDLNSENYFYPLTTIDQIILQDNSTRLNSLIDKSNFSTNKAIYYDGTKLLSSENIFLNNNQIAINKTSITEGYNFEVNGNSLFNNNVQVNGKILMMNSADSVFLGAFAEQQLNKTNVRTWCDTATNIHKSSYQGDMILKRFFSQDEAAATYNLPCVDSHMLIFSIDGSSSINWTRILALDMRSPILFIGGKNGATWQSWTQLITDNTVQTITAQKTFTQLILGTSNQARFLENRGGSTVAISDVAWGHGHTPNGHTNRATIWHQRWYQSGLTYTPSGGSATTLTDCGDMVLWLSSSNTGNALQCNMALDGNIYLLGNIKAGGGRFGYDNYSYNFSASTGIFNSRLYCNEWIQFNGKTGLYFPNSGSGTHFYPANDCTYGGFQMQGTKGGYYGITSGPNNNFLTFMSQTQHQGLYNAANSQWVLYYDKTNKRACILGSSTESSYPIYLNASTRIIGACYVNSSLYVALPAAGSIYCGTYKDTAHGEHQIQINSGAGRLYMYAQAAATANRGLYGHNNAGTACSYLYIQQDNYVRAGTRLYGAVWNDYAEFRKGQMDNLKPGQVVTENGDGTMHLANQKLQKGCKILSDTYGFALGETEEYKLPIAVSGRVLVYCDTPNEELEPGDCLCANYTGNAIKMTEEEIIKYPDRIIATVSEFPNYEIWHAGDQTNKDGMKEEVKVNGRIWVYVR